MSEETVDLWAVHVVGPDDLLAAPDHDQARSLAKRLRDYFATWPVDEYRPHMNAIVVVWPHSADAHAKEVARLRSEGTWQRHEQV
jgi:hypothetical protein